MLKIKETKNMGRGLFSTHKIKKNKILLVNNLIFSDKKSKNSDFENYVFGCDGSYFIALGEGSLINHSSSPNVEAQIDLQKKKIYFVAIKSINSGDQLFLDYGYDPSKQKDSASS